MLKYLAYPKLPDLVRFSAVVLAASLALALVIKARQVPLESADVPVEPVQEGFVSELPDFESITDIDLKKQSFFTFLNDYIEAENRHMLENRARLQEFAHIVAGGGHLSPTERRTFDAIAAEYRMADSELPMIDLVDELLVRADVIPVSLALAQAANESAWGTSRFAREGNNIFGQWCFDEGCGLIPDRRADDKSHEVRAFASIEASVKAYFRNLNTNPTYEYLRELRAQMRMQGRDLDPMELAMGLSRYSERGSVYIDELQSMIRSNNLIALDQETVEAEADTAG